MRSRSTGRLDWTEVSLAAALVVALSWCASAWYHEQPAHPDQASLEQKYGPDRHSQFEEEWIVRDFFGDRRNGIFVDVGANHYQVFSNTFYLEDQLGWSGLAVEPLRRYEADYRAYRPRTTFLPFFVSDTSNSAATMYLIEHHPRVASSNRATVERHSADYVEIEAPTITLNDLLDAEGLDTFDFLSMDIERAEPEALAGFDIDRFRPALVCIEAHVEVRQTILDYFASHGYVVVGDYLRADSRNLYFAPLSPA